MHYAGFWKRVGAGIIDVLIFLPLLLVELWAFSTSWTVALVIRLLSDGPLIAYFIVMHARGGQTVGKMMMDIKLVMEDGREATWKAAFLRSSVDVGFLLLAEIAWVMAFFAVPADSFLTLEGARARMETLQAALPAWSHGAEYLASVWALSEYVVILFNQKRRALHDFLAGTVIIDLAAK